MNPGEVFLSQEHFGAMSKANLVGSFFRNDNLMRGRRGGAHQSYAGNLVLKSLDDQAMTETVFVKPYLGPMDCRNGNPVKDMAHEIAANNAIADHFPYRVTFNVIGIAKSYNKTPQLITEFDTSVTAISNLLRPKQGESLPTVEQIVQGFKIGMYEAAALVGGARMTHRDFHVGNVARDIKFRPWFNDNETALPLETRHDQVRDTAQNRQRVLNDLNHFFYSSTNPQFTRRSVATMVFGIIDKPELMEAILSSYSNSLAENSAISATSVPDRYYMSLSQFMLFAKNAMARARGHFGKEES